MKVDQSSAEGAICMLFACFTGNARMGAMTGTSCAPPHAGICRAFSASVCARIVFMGLRPSGELRSITQQCFDLSTMAVGGDVAVHNIERAKLALEMLYPNATVEVESHVVNLSAEGGYGENTSVSTCHGFKASLPDGRRLVCVEWYTDEYFEGVSLDDLKSFFEERCCFIA